MSIEERKPSVLVEGTLRDGVSQIFGPVSYFDADKRFLKEDSDSWPDGKLDKKSYEEKLKNLKERGFREYLPQITLTKTEFQPDAKFVAVQVKNEKVEAERILKEIEMETGKKWQLEVIVETYEQNQKKARVFIREKYGREALGEVAKTLRSRLGGEYLLKKGDNGYPQDNRCWVIEALEEGDVLKARVDFEQQGDKWNKQLTDYLESWLFDEENLSTRQRIKKWQENDD